LGKTPLCGTVSLKYLLDQRLLDLRGQCDEQHNMADTIEEDALP